MGQTPMRKKEIFYQVAKDVRKRMRRSRWYPSLTGCCAICSYRIFKRLKELGYKPAFVENYYHCFVLCDKYLIDVTASQFGFGEIYVVPFPYLRHRWWTVKRRATTDQGIRNILSNWSNDQIPSELRRLKVS